MGLRSTWNGRSRGGCSRYWNGCPGVEPTSTDLKSCCSRLSGRSVQGTDVSDRGDARESTAARSPRISRGPLYPIDDCGHFLIGERPDAFVEALETALASGETGV